jgi:flagellar basal-body rod modification protein FlgD
MSLSPVNFRPPVETGATAGQAESALGEEDFLSLMMTQMKHQDPLSPMDTNQFMDQITQMNTVKQLMSANEKLSQLTVGVTSINNESAVNLVGHEVVAQGDSFFHEAGSSEELVFELGGEAQEVVVTVTDESGTVVDTIEMGELGAGEHQVTWSGRNTGGGRAPEGNYQYSVNTVDDTGQPVGVTTFVTGLVEELRFVNGQPMLYIDGQEVGLGAILRVLNTPPNPQESTPGDASSQGASADPNSDVSDGPSAALRGAVGVAAYR